MPYVKLLNIPFKAGTHPDERCCIKAHSLTRLTRKATWSRVENTEWESACVQEYMLGSVQRQATSCTVHFAQLIYLHFSNCEMAIVTQSWCCYYLCTLSSSASSRDRDPAGEGGLKLGSRGKLWELTLHRWQYGMEDYTSRWEGKLNPARTK